MKKARLLTRQEVLANKSGTLSGPGMPSKAETQRVLWTLLNKIRNADKSGNNK